MQQHSPNSKILPVLLHFFPYALYFGMQLLLHVIDLLAGTNTDAAGSEMGWNVIKVIVIAAISLVCSAISYPSIVQWEQSGNKIGSYMLFVALNYPFEYAFFSLPLLALQAGNLPAVVGTPGFSSLVVVLSSLLACLLPKLMAAKYKDLRQRVYQGVFIRFASVFILVFIIIAASLWLAGPR